MSFVGRHAERAEQVFGDLVRGLRIVAARLVVQQLAEAERGASGDRERQLGVAHGEATDADRGPDVATGAGSRKAIHELAPELSDASVRLLTTYALVGADGLFVAREIGGDDVDLVALFELHARVLLDAVACELGAELVAESPGSS